MPTASDVLKVLERISQDLWWLAAAWHVLTGAFLLALAMGRRPPSRWVSASLSGPLLSVSLTAWSTGNPFNGFAFLIVALVILFFARRLSRDAVAPASTSRNIPAFAMIAFGWIYPHFLEDGSFLRYLWAAPLGLVPCPSLSLVVGLAFLLENGISRAVSMILGGAGAFWARPS